MQEHTEHVEFEEVVGLGRPVADVLEQTHVVERPRSRWPFFVAVAGIVAAAGFLAVSVLGRSEELSPAGAAGEMVAAMNDGDLLGLVAVMPPGEREALAEPVLSVIDEMQRVGILGPAIDGDDIGPMPSITITDPVFTVVAESPDLVVVAVDHDGVSLPGDLASVLLTDRMVELVGSGGGRAGADAVDPGRFRLVTVREDGRWYVSPVHSILEAIRAAEDRPFPAAPIPTAPGAQTAAAVLDDLADSLVDGELTRAMQLLDPREARGIHRYAAVLFDPERTGRELRRDLAASGATIAVDLETDVGSDDRGTFVTLTEMSVTAQIDDGEIAYRWANGCFELTFRERGERSERSMQCSDGSSLPFSGEATEGWDLPDELRPPLLDAYADGRLDVGGIRVSEVDGSWYLSPWQTGWAWLADLLRPLDAATVDATIEWFRERADDPEGAAELVEQFLSDNEAITSVPFVGILGYGFPRSGEGGDLRGRGALVPPIPDVGGNVSTDLLPPDLDTSELSADETYAAGFASTRAGLRGSLHATTQQGESDEFFVYHAIEFDSAEAAEREFDSWSPRGDGSADPPVVDGQPVDDWVYSGDFGNASGVIRRGRVIYHVELFTDLPIDMARHDKLLDELDRLDEHATGG